MTKFFALLLLVVFSVGCRTTTYFITRHAERAGAATADPGLTPRGEQQAQALRRFLEGKRIRAVYSTNTARTLATARPTAEAYNLTTRLYQPAAGAGLVDSLKQAAKNNVLIVGHSNTVDDLVNRFTGATTLRDLPDTAYGDVFILKKKGGAWQFSRTRLQLPTP